MQTNPEQWAVELATSLPAWFADFDGIALAIQAAFAEREARLVALLKRAQEIMPGPYIHWHDDVTAALKDRTHG